MQTLQPGICWAIELKPHSLQSTLRLRRLDLHQVQRRFTFSMLTGHLLCASYVLHRRSGGPTLWDMVQGTA